METTHTPRKWEIGWGNGLTGPTTPSADGPCCGEDRAYVPISKGKETIAIIPLPENNNHKEMLMNAKLIAAAPDLLDALIKINQGFISEYGIEGNSERVCKNIDYWNKIAAKAIKKAIG